MAGSDVDYVELPIYKEELAQALNFSPSDLEANHAGRLGANQVANLRYGIARAGLISLLLAVVAVGCVAAAIAVGIGTLISLGALVIAACCAAWIGIGVWYNVPLWKDVKARTVSTVDGFVSAGERETDVRTGPLTSLPIWSYYWTVDNLQRFWVTGKAYATLTPARHRLYFLPSSRRIVAAEPLTGAAK